MTDSISQYPTAIERRLNPKNKEDFNLLSLELTYWQNKKFAEIDEKNISDEKKNILRLHVLSQETTLIRKIDSLKRGVHKDNERQELESFLREKTLLPVWNIKDGTQIEVETVNSRKAAQLISLYHQLNINDNTAGKIFMLKKKKPSLICSHL